MTEKTTASGAPNPARPGARMRRLALALPAMALLPLAPMTVVLADDQTVGIAQEMDGEHFVSWTRANIRALPAGDAEVLERLEFGSRLWVTGAVEDSDWFRVETDAVPVGYVWGPVLQPMDLFAARQPAAAEPTGPSGPGPSAANSPGDAMDFGTLAMGDTVTVEGAVGTNNNHDYYRFSVDDWSIVTIDMDQLVSDVDIELLDQNQNQLSYSIRGGAEPEHMQSMLAAGEYFVRVYIFSGDSGYRLRINAEASEGPPESFAGNSRDDATDLGSLADSAVFQEGWVSTSLNPDDFYRIDVTERSALRITLTGLMDDADLTLEDDFGSVIDSSMYGGAEDELIERRVNPGTYYIRVNAFSGQSPYMLDVTATPTGPARPGEDSSNPIPLAAAADWPASVDGYLTDQEVYYGFALEQSERVRIEMSPADADLDIELLEARTGNTISMSTYGGTMAEEITADLDPGDYLLRIWQFGGPSAYVLEIGLHADMAPSKP